MSTEKLGKGWTPAEKLSKPNRYSVDLWGAGGSGKTHFIVHTCPGPIALINFDRDPSRLIVESKRKDVFVRNLHTEGLWMTDHQARETYKRFEEALRDALTLEEGTIAVDGGSAMNHLLEQLALAEYNDTLLQHGKDTVERLPSLQRARINSRILNMCASVSQTPLNFVITHQQREIWSSEGKPLGRYEARENTQIQYGVDISLWMFVNKQEATKTQPSELRHFAKVAICKSREKLIDRRFENPTWDLIVAHINEEE